MRAVYIRARPPGCFRICHCCDGPKGSLDAQAFVWRFGMCLRPQSKGCARQAYVVDGLAIQQFEIKLLNEAEQRGRRDPVAIDSWPLSLFSEHAL